MEQFDNKRIESLMSKGRMGWWEADFVKQQYRCSPFISRLLNLGPEGVISFEDFRNLITVFVRLMSLHSEKHKTYTIRFILLLPLKEYSGCG